MERKIAASFEIKGVQETVNELAALEFELDAVNKKLREAKKTGDEDAFKGAKQSQEALRDSIKDVRKELRQQVSDFKKQKFPEDSLIGLRKRYSELTKTIKELSKAERDSDVGENLIKIAGEIQAEIKKTDKEIRGLTEVVKEIPDDSLKALKKRYSELRKEVQLLSKEQRESDFGENLIKQAKAIKDEILEVDKSIGDFTSNIGNYKSAFNNLGGILAGTNKETINIRQSYNELIGVQRTLSEEIEILSKEFDDLPNSIKKTSKAQKQYLGEVEKLKKEIEEIGEVTGKGLLDFQDSFIDKLEDSGGALGGTAKSVKGLGKSFKALLANPVVATLAAITAVLGAVFTAFTKTERGSNLMATATGVLNGILSASVGVVDDLVTSFIEFTDNPIEGIKKLGESIQNNLFNRFEGLVNLFKITGEAIGSLVTGDFENLKKISTEAGVAATQLATGLDEVGQKEVVENLKKFSKEVENTVVGFTKLEQSRKGLAAQNRALTIAAEKLATQEALLQQTADDSTKSFKEQETAAAAAREVLEQKAEVEVKLARNGFALINEEIKLRRQNGENIDDLAEQQTSALQGVLAAERNFAIAIGDNEKQLSQLKQDRLERDLDILLDGFDNQKTINEKIINNDKGLISSRQDLLNETVKLGNESFIKQIETIQQFTSAQLNANDLIQESDSIVLNEKIRALGLSEIIEGRLLEVIRDRKSAIQDLTETQRDLTEATENQSIQDIEGNRDAALNKLFKDTTKTNEEIAAEKIKIENRANLEIISKRLESENLTNNERKALELELTQGIINQKEEANEKILNDELLNIQLVKDARIKATEESGSNQAKTAKEVAEIERKALIETLQTRLKLEKLSGEERLEIERDLRKAINSENENEGFEALNKRLQATLKATSAVIQGIGSLRETQFQNELNDISEREAAELKAVEGNAEKEKEVKDKFDAERRKAEEENFERNKRLSLSLAVINGSLAILNVLATNKGGAIARAIEIAGVVVATGLQIKEINAQEFAEGGVVGAYENVNGLITQAPNTKRTAGGDDVLIKAKRGEVVLNESQQKRLETLTNKNIWGKINLPTRRKSTFMDGGIVGGGIPQLVNPNDSFASIQAAQKVSVEVSQSEEAMKQFAQEVATATGRAVAGAIIESTKITVRDSLKQNNKNNE